LVKFFFFAGIAGSEKKADKKGELKPIKRLVGIAGTIFFKGRQKNFSDFTENNDDKEVCS